MAHRIRDQSPEERRLEAELLRDEFDEADEFDRPALVQLMKGIAEEDQALENTWPLSPNLSAVYVPPETAFEPLAAAGGYATTFTLEFEGEGSVEIDASWTSERLDLSWEYRGFDPSSYLIIAFRDPATSRFLAPPQVVGRLDLQSWSISANETAVKFDSPWEIVVLFM